MKSSTLVIIILFGLILFLSGFSTCSDQKIENNNFENFVGSQSCSPCHQVILDSHSSTAHYLSSQHATEMHIKGSFAIGKNEYKYSPVLSVKMEKRQDSLLQIAYYKGQEKMAMPMDIIFGSGTKGQSFLSWRKNKLYQLPITFYTTANVWSNSPGYPPGKVVIDKPITARCLECHTTFASGLAGTALEPTDFNPKKLILGIDCEKCHGPAKKHVEFQTKNPSIKSAKFITNPAHFTRQQNLDLCSQCHSGQIQKSKPSFSFSPGNKLKDFFIINNLDEKVIANGNVDVHGNQYGLLAASKCFISSGTMTCNTCHNSHKNERGKKELFSNRCMECHEPKKAILSKAHQGLVGFEKNCIDCHMPALASKAITLFLEGEETPRASLVRSHFISIYPHESKKIKASTESGN